MVAAPDRRDPHGRQNRNFAGDDPFKLARPGLPRPRKSEINDPNAIALASVDPDGLPNVRMVLLKEIEAPGAGEGRLRLLHQLRQRQGAGASRPRARRPS
jgi:hypothetical protein